MSTKTVVDSRTFTKGDIEMTVETMSDGGAGFCIEDRYGGAYNNGSSEGFELDGNQVNQLRDLLS